MFVVDPSQLGVTSTLKAEPSVYDSISSTIQELDNEEKKEQKKKRTKDKERRRRRRRMACCMWRIDEHLT
jgi:hypothetical protein